MYFFYFRCSPFAGSPSPSHLSLISLSLSISLSSSSSSPLLEHPKAKATFAYTATKESHLTIDEGEIVTVVNNEKSWWVVRNAAGQSGKVPSNYMELVGASDSSTTATSPASAGTSGMENMPWFHADINDRTVAEHRLSVCVLVLRHACVGKECGWRWGHCIH